MPLANVGLRFSSGLIVGRWDIPNVNTRPVEFKRVAEDIGFAITMGIAKGEIGCFFVDMADAPDLPGQKPKP